MHQHHLAPDDLVVLVDEHGQSIGTANRGEVHGSDTPLHLAFSCYLFDRRGRVLLTRRALGKKTWPGVWTNACCGHPRPGEAPREAVRRRLADELGLGADDLRLILPHFAYRATDASGVVENELCPVWVAVVDATPTPDPAEVAELAWVDWSAVVTAARTAPFLLSPWSALQIPLLEEFFSTESGVA
ncbi:MAG: isopentenyl-diphosphate Delta-isomerase [Candidatus Nanopelagicales bacterium]